jgi:hypothetical protein
MARRMGHIYERVDVGKVRGANGTVVGFDKLRGPLQLILKVFLSVICIFMYIFIFNSFFVLVSL